MTIGDVSLKEGILVVRRSKGRKPRLIAVGGERCAPCAVTRSSVRGWITAMFRRWRRSSRRSMAQALPIMGCALAAPPGACRGRAASPPAPVAPHLGTRNPRRHRRLADGPAQTGPRRHSHDPGVLEYDSRADRGAAARLQPGRSPWLRNRQPLREIGKATARTGASR